MTDLGNKIGIGLLGLGTVGTGVASILLDPHNRHPLVSQLEIINIAVNRLDRPRAIDLPPNLLTTNPQSVVDNPKVQVVVEVMGGIEPALSLIMRAISSGKSVVTANKTLIARHGDEIAAAANKAGVYVLIEAAVGGGIPIIEPIKQSLCGNRINKVSGIINGTTNYILSRMAEEGVPYQEVLNEAKELGYAEADPTADVEGLDAADKIAILSGLAFGGSINRSEIPTEGISNLKSRDVDFAKQLGYVVKLIAKAERKDSSSKTSSSLPLAVQVKPTLVPLNHPLAGVNGVNNAILIEGDPIGKVMFYGPGAGSGPTASAVVADILNIAGIYKVTNTGEGIDPLLAANSWRECHIVDPSEITQKNYVRFVAKDTPGVIGRIGSHFGDSSVSIQSIVQLDASEQDAEIVVITKEVKQGQMKTALDKIKQLPDINVLVSHLGCI